MGSLAFRDPLWLDLLCTLSVLLLFCLYIYRGRSNRHNLVDMAVLILQYADTHNSHNSSQHPSPLPIACSLHSGSHIQSIVTAEGFLTPGRYVILPLAFNHYRHITQKGSQGSDSVDCTDGGRGRDIDRQQSEEGFVPYVVALFSARELAYENVTTRPGFLPESLMLLAEKIGKVTQVYITHHHSATHTYHCVRNTFSFLFSRFLTCGYTRYT